VAFKQDNTSDLTNLSGQHSLGVIPANVYKAGLCKKFVSCSKNGRRRATRYCYETCFSEPALCCRMFQTFSYWTWII